MTRYIGIIRHSTAEREGHQIIPLSAITHHAYARNHCPGVLDYIYGFWWKCRTCGGWSRKW